MHIISLAPLTPATHADALQQVYRATPQYWAMYNLPASPGGQARRDLEAAETTAGRHMLGIVRHVPSTEIHAEAADADGAEAAPDTSTETATDTKTETDAGPELELVGAVDLRLYWPGADQAYIGMVMVAEPFQREGIGTQAWTLLRPWLAETAKVKTARLGVEQFNPTALHFFQSLGFALTGETNRIEVGSKWVRLLYMELAL
ncbi:MAG: GNAT family N-acetyltransferase [Litorilinea sp.]